MTDSILGIGLSGLTAAQAGLSTTGHNIANVNTPGYSRQEAIQATRQPLYTGSGYIGQGVDVTSVRRIYSDFLAARTLRSQAESSQLDALQTQLSQIDNLFSDATTGLAPAIDQFFSGLNAMAANPSDLSARQSALSGAQGLVSRFHQVDGELASLKDAANQRVAASVQQINGLASQIAVLNRRIADASNADSSQSPNDLLDQRDQLVSDLNKQIGATVVVQTDGSYNVFLSNGQGLVVGTQPYALTAVPDSRDPSVLQVGLQTGSTVLRFQSSDFSGGELAGTLAFRDQYLQDAQNSLGRVAAALGTTINSRNALGLDLNGAMGGALFSLPAVPVQSATTNTGNAVVAAAITDPTGLTTSDYRVSYDGAAYVVTRLSDNTSQTFATLPQTVDGVSISITSGAAAAGDTFLVQPTRTAARDIDVAITDPKRLAAAAPIRTSFGTGNVGNATISVGSVDASYPAAPLGTTVTLSFDGTTGNLNGFPATAAVTAVQTNGTSTTYAPGASVPYTSDTAYKFNGISVTLSGTPANSDTFTIAPNTGGIGDNRNARLMADLARQNTLDGGTASFHDAYAQLVSDIGGAMQEVSSENDAQSQLLSQAQAAQSAASGVNLDEEAANLQKYQQAYQASAKVIAIAASMFQTILDIGKSS
jgi:flagellar hook-associated protein 1 FlgK